MSTFGAPRVNFRRRRAVDLAAAALARLPCSPDDTPRNVELIAALWASGARKRLVRAAASWVGAATKFDFEGADAVYALAANAATAQAGIECEPLRRNAALFASALAGDGAPAAGELALACHLLRLGGCHVPKLASVSLPAPPRHWLLAERSEHMEMCRTIASVTAWGVLPTKAREFEAGLPLLCLSYARDWDIEAVCALLRACSYLNLQHERPCVWATDWLLDQQCEDGHFGLFGPEAVVLGRNPDDPYLRFPFTVSAVFALSNGDAWGRVPPATAAIGPSRGSRVNGHGEIRGPRPRML